MLKLPQEIKIALVKKNTTLKEWAREKGFNYSTVFSVATGVLQPKSKNTKSYKIKKALEEELLGVIKNESSGNRRTAV